MTAPAPPRRVGSGYLEIVTAASVWGSAGVIVKLIDASPAMIALGRFLCATLFLLVARRLLRPGAVAVSWRGRRQAAVIGVVTAATWVLFIWSFRFIPVADAVLLLFCSPVLTTAAARYFLGEQVGGRARMALAMAVLGAALLTLQARDGAAAQASTGVALALGAAVLMSIETLLLKTADPAMAGETVNIYRYGTGALVLSPVLVLPAPYPDGTAMALIGALGLFHGALAGTLFVRGLRKAEVHRVAVLGYVEPLSATLLAWAFLGERPGILTGIAGALIVAGGVLVVSARRGGARAGQIAPAAMTDH